jgi:hypothetical protein
MVNKSTAINPTAGLDIFLITLFLFVTHKRL